MTRPLKQVTPDGNYWPIPRPLGPGVLWVVWIVILLVSGYRCFLYQQSVIRSYIPLSHIGTEAVQEARYALQNDTLRYASIVTEPHIPQSLPTFGVNITAPEDANIIDQLFHYVLGTDFVTDRDPQYDDFVSNLPVLLLVILFSVGSTKLYSRYVQGADEKDLVCRLFNAIVGIVFYIALTDGNTIFMLPIILATCITVGFLLMPYYIISNEERVWIGHDSGLIKTNERVVYPISSIAVGLICIVLLLLAEADVLHSGVWVNKGGLSLGFVLRWILLRLVSAFYDIGMSRKEIQKKNADSPISQSVVTPPSILSIYNFKAVAWKSIASKESEKWYTDPDNVEHCVVGIVSYIFWAPLIAAGPVCQYNDFINCWITQDESMNPELSFRRDRAFAKRLPVTIQAAASCLMCEAFRRIFFFSSMFVETDSADKMALLANVGIFQGWFALELHQVFMVLKFAAIWKTFRAWSLWQGVYVQDNISRIPLIQVFDNADLWGNWHGTINRWAIRYVYVPLGGNKCSLFRQFLNPILVFVFIAMWHGPYLRFLMWGIVSGLAIVLERAFRETFRRYASGLPYVLKYIIYTYWTFGCRHAAVCLNHIGYGFGFYATIHITINSLLNLSKGNYAIIELTVFLAISLVRQTLIFDDMQKRSLLFMELKKAPTFEKKGAVYFSHHPRERLLPRLFSKA